MAQDKELIEKEKHNREALLKAVADKKIKSALNLKRSYLLSILVLFTAGMVFLASGYFLYYVTTYKVPSKYIPVDNESRIYKPIPLSEDLFSEESLKQWVVDFVYDYSEYNYTNLEKHADSVSVYFYSDIYDQFVAKFFTESNDVKVLRKKFGINYAVDVKPVKIDKVGMLAGGRKAWIVNTTFRQVTRYGEGQQSVVDKKVSLTIVRATLEESPHRLLIAKISITDAR